MANDRKTSKKRPKGAGRNGNVLPKEYQFKPGNTAAVGHGRPRTISELRELVQEIGAEGLTQDGLTRIAAKVRLLYASKNAGDTATLLAYGWGKPKQEIEIDDTNGLSDEQRAERIAILLDAARARRDGQAPDSTDEGGA